MKRMSRMKTFRINDIFYSLQGEGRNTGRAAVFIRFAGCNLKCSFCDTEFDSYKEMTADEILKAIADYKAKFVVLTGGEPTLQADDEFIDLLHTNGYEVAMESNGTRNAPKNIDWLTVSPKIMNNNMGNGDARIPDEIKIVFTQQCDPEEILSAYIKRFGTIEKNSYPLLYLQPCDTGNSELNKKIMSNCIDYIEKHPKWRLSLQTHKLINIK